MNLDLSGLDALAAGGLFTGAAPGKALDLALAAIDFDPEQPRGRIDDARLAELADSIRQHGVLQAISVRPHPSSTGRYLVNFGERRVRASRLAQRLTIPAVIEAHGDPYTQAIENLQREDLSPLDLARFIARREQDGDSRATIARKLGKPRSFISEIASLGEAPAPVRALCESGRCSDVRTLYTLARACRDNAPGVATLLSDDGPITRERAEAAAKGEALGPPTMKRAGAGRGRNRSARALQVALDGRTGELDWTQQPSPTSARVRFEDGALETIELPRLQLIAWADPE